jgi:hypothetical protein
MKHKFDSKKLNLPKLMILIPASLGGIIAFLFLVLTTFAPYSSKSVNILKWLSELFELILNNLIVSIIVFALIDLILAYILLKIIKYKNIKIIEKEIKESQPEFILTDRSRKIIQKQSDVFLNMQIEIEQLSVHSTKPVGSIIKKKDDRDKETFALTDKAIKIILDKIDPRKHKDIKKAYDFFKYPHKEIFDKELIKSSFKESICNVYDFTEAQMVKYIGDEEKAKTGKDLAILNLQEIINLLK